MGAQYFNLKRVSVFIREVKLEGYAPSDAIGVEWNDDLVIVDTTADGQKVVSRTNDNGMNMIFNLMNTSEAYQRLAQLMTELYGLGSPIETATLLPFGLRLVDPAIGDFISSEYAVFLNRPAPYKGRQAGIVQFRVLLPNPRVFYGLRNRRLIP